MRRSRWLGLVLLVPWLGACAGRYDDLCAEARDCARGNDADEEACIARMEAHEEYASVTECEEEWDAYFDCYELLNTCNKDLDVPMLVPKDGCSGEVEDLNDCWD